MGKLKRGEKVSINVGEREVKCLVSEKLCHTLHSLDINEHFDTMIPSQLISKGGDNV